MGSISHKVTGSAAFSSSSVSASGTAKIERWQSIPVPARLKMGGLTPSSLTLVATTTTLGQIIEATMEADKTDKTTTSDAQIGISIWPMTISIFTPIKVSTIA